MPRRSKGGRRAGGTPPRARPSTRRRPARARGGRRADGIPQLRYPITSALIRTSELGVFIRVAQLRSWIGRRDPVSWTAIVTQGVTSLEQLLRLILEELLDKRRKGGPSYVVVRVKGGGGGVRVSRSRIVAFMKGFQNFAAICWMAEKCDLKALRRFLAEHKKDIVGMFGMRHDLTHALATDQIEEEKAMMIIGLAMRAAMDGRPIYVVVALLVEASIMEAAGRAGDARRAAEEALEICDRILEGWRAGGGAGDADAGVDAGVDGPAVRVCRAHALARLRRTDEAEAAYREAAEQSPRGVLPLLGMGHLLVQAGRPEEAVEWYKRAVAIDPGHVSSRTSMGHALAIVRGADGTRAVQCYREALLSGLEDVSLRAGYGTALAMTGHYGEAAEQYRKAIELDPGDAAAHVGLGNALAALKKHGEAAKMYGEGIRLGAAAVTVRGYAHDYAHDAEEAEGGVFALGLGGAAAHRGLGNSLIETGSPERAAVVLGRAVALDSESLEAQSGLGRALYMCGRYEEAVRAGQRAVEIDAGSLEAQSGLGDALYMCGRYEEAVIAYRAALALDIDDREVRRGLMLALNRWRRYAGR